MDQTEATAGALYSFPGHLTAQLPGTGGVLRATPDDFVVDELPLYGPSGAGQHTLFAIEKRGLTTFEALRQIARGLGIGGQRLGAAGLKDADAVCRQVLSVEGVPPERLLRLALPQVRVLWAERHRNRLKIGHLRGNRFTIRIRHTLPQALSRAEAILSALDALGAPNGFGPQRFGLRGNSHWLGLCLLRGDATGFLRLFLGQPQTGDPEASRTARSAYDEGDLAGALRVWPHHLSAEHHALVALHLGGAPEEVVRREIPPSLKRLLIAAHQAALFNRLLALRVPHLGRLGRGDLALKHANGAFFEVADPDQEQPRADKLEISPTGPLYGYKVRLASGEPGARERGLLTAEGLEPTDWRLGQGLSARGERRPFRVPLWKPQVQAMEDGLLLSFALPAGAYATSVLAEVMKGEQRTLDRGLVNAGG